MAGNPSGCPPFSIHMRTVTGFFNNLKKFDGPRSISGLKLLRCHFDGCGVAPAYDLATRTHIRDIEISQCTVANCGVNGAILENVKVDGLKTKGRMPFFCFGSFFRHVILRGKIGSLKINSECHIHSYRTPRQQAIWDEAYQQFYKDVDWAIDIRDAEFKTGIDFHFVPGRLVRRDPATQVLVTRERLEKIDWKSIDWGGSSVIISLQWFLERSVHADCVIVARSKSRSFERDIKALDLLRTSGIAERD